MARSVDKNRPAGSRQSAGVVRRAVRALARRTGVAQNPLRRPSDRLEAGARVAALLLSVLGLWAAVAVGVLVLGSERSGAAHTAAAHHAVTATIVSTPRAIAVPGRAVAVSTARVAWSTPAGVDRVGSSVVAPGAERGDLTTVWVTDAGDLTSAPLSRGDAAAVAVLSATAVFLSTVGLLALLLAGLRRLLDQRRYRDWARDWARFESAQRR